MFFLAQFANLSLNAKKLSFIVMRCCVLALRFVTPRISTFLVFPHLAESLTPKIIFSTFNFFVQNVSQKILTPMSFRTMWNPKGQIPASFLVEFSIFKTAYIINFGSRNFQFSVIQFWIPKIVLSSWNLRVMAILFGS